MKKNLVLATECYPFGKGEKPLIETELDALIENFNLTIVSHAPREVVDDGDNRTRFDDTVRIVNIDMNMPVMYKIIYSCRFFFDIDGWKELLSILRSRKSFFTCLYQSLGYYILAMYNWNQMKKYKVIDPNVDTLYYSYWFYYYTYSVTKHRKKYKNLKVVTRTHGFDLYDERYKGGRQPFRKLEDNRLDRVLFVCETARKYYISKSYSKDSSRYLVARMGTKARKSSEIARSCSDNFVLVSCSNLIPLKRIPLIIQALSAWDDERCVEWHHFGDGEDRDYVTQMAEKELAKKQNICYKLHGFTLNSDVMKFYSQNRIDSFINVSETEGCPVSIQEAMAYGIPIIGTDVGGVAELIQGNGILLNVDISGEEIRNAVRYMIKLPSKQIDLMRNKSYELWETSYQSEKNAFTLVKIFERLTSEGK